MVDSYDEDDPERRDIGAISSAYVRIGVYSLTGIPDSEITPDPERALEMFQFAATNFGDPEAEYRLARMYSPPPAPPRTTCAPRVPAIGCRQGHDGRRRCSGICFHRRRRAELTCAGSMWLWIAKSGAKNPNDAWIRDLQVKDHDTANDDDREVCQATSARAARTCAS